jgi:hypothetical protein
VKKAIIVFFFPVIILLLATTCAAQELETEQWIYDAIDYLNQLEFGELYSDVNPGNRYQVSLAIANTIQRLELNSASHVQRFGVSRKISLKGLFDNYNQQVSEQERLPEKAISVLILLADEYRDELNVLGYWIEDLPGEALSYKPDYATTSIMFEGSVPGADPAVNLNSQERPGAFREEIVETLNKESVLSKYFSDDGTENTRILINSLIPLWSSDWFIGAGLSLPSLPRDWAEEPESSGYASIIGEYLINQDLVLEGQYLHNLAQPFDAGVLQFGARGRIGNITLRGLVQTPEDEEEGAKASLDITYATPNSILIKAGYNANLKTVSQLGFASSSATIGVDIPIPQGRIMLGLEQTKSQEGSGSDQGDQAADQTKASIGFSYDLTNEVSFKLDYRLIDFSDVNKALAEFSIRF